MPTRHDRDVGEFIVAASLFCLTPVAARAGALAQALAADLAGRCPRLDMAVICARDALERPDAENRQRLLIACRALSGAPVPRCAAAEMMERLVA